MQRDKISAELCRLAFDFFYWFSRFEFALKEARFLKNSEVGAKAEVSWRNFILEFEGNYDLTEAGRALIDANPKRQIVSQTGLEFCELTFGNDASNLEKVIRLTQTVRNNLFHGGKHGGDYWDQPDRIRMLLTIGIQVLHELADQAGLQGDYRRYY